MEERQTIITLKNVSLSFRETAKKTNVSESTVCFTTKIGKTSFCGSTVCIIGGLQDNSSTTTVDEVMKTHFQLWREDRELAMKHPQLRMVLWCHRPMNQNVKSSVHQDFCMLLTGWKDGSSSCDVNCQTWRRTHGGLRVVLLNPGQSSVQWEALWPTASSAAACSTPHWT